MAYALTVPAILRRPEIIDMQGVVDIYADICVVVGGKETVRINLAVERDGSHYELCGRIFMPISSFRQSLLWAAADYGMGLAAH